MAGAFFLLRHGETQWNREGRIQGHRDSPLTRRGVAQALAMGERLRPLIAAFARTRLAISPLGRCRQTAALLSEAAGLDFGAVTFEAGLMELTLGAWDGRLWEEIEEGARAAYLADRWHGAPPGGESYATAALRARDVLDRYGPVPEGEALVVVSHGGLGRLLRGLHLGLREAETLRLEQPQDAFFRLDRSGAERIATG